MFPPGPGCAGGPMALRGWRWPLCDGVTGLSPGRGAPAAPRAEIVLHPHPWLWPAAVSPSLGALGPLLPDSAACQGGAFGAGSSSCSCGRFKGMGSVPRVALDYAARAAPVKEAGDAGA